MVALDVGNEYDVHRGAQFNFHDQANIPTIRHPYPRQRDCPVLLIPLKVRNITGDENTGNRPSAIELVS